MTPTIRRCCEAVVADLTRKPADGGMNGCLFDVSPDFDATIRGHVNLPSIVEAVLRTIRKADSKMLRAMSASMSPGKRPTPKRVSERAKHGIRFRAAIDAALGDRGIGK